MHREDLVPTEDEAPIEAYITEIASAPPSPPSFLHSLIRPPRTRAAMAQMRAAAPSTYHPLLPSRTPPLLSILLHAPSISRRVDIPEADTPPRKRLLLTAPKPGYEVGESSAAARQLGTTMTRRVDYSSVDTVETRVRDTERRMMAALEVVNLRLSYQVDVRSRESSAALEARVTVLETQAHRHEWQRQDVDDRATRHIMRIHALEAGARDDTLRILYCNNCKKVGHLAKDCRSRPANANNNNPNNNNNNQKGNGCYECGAQGHFRRNCPKLKKNDRGNQARNDKAPAKVYVVGNAGANPDNAIAGTFLLNNRYAYILFDTGADRSFVSTTFSSQIDITPSILDHYYDVKLADGRIIGLNTILSGCTLNFLNHPFNINLMPVELGSFDAIIGMDWLAKYQAIIVCAEKKIVRIPWKSKTLIIHSDGSTQGNVTRLNIISCTKTQKYMGKGFPFFLERVTAKEVEDKLEKKPFEDVPIVQDFPRVFPEDLPGLPPTQQVDF
ncbi:putative reverse transcriptase domain-containing protein [Tanacetum coccineum]|uniref:Reverse transcriptase domain-containing protein n=1 Tax=Tanacetum coccineum TaxID=301880 RepID=A0ABQ5JDQ6_9ASTR